MKKRFFSMLFILALCFAVTVSAFAEAVQYIGIGTREITLTGSGASFSCEGVRAEGSVITIFEPGEYTVSGTLDDGQIIVDTGYSIEKTSITLSGASVTCLNDAAIYVRQAEKVKIYMAEGTENTVTSGKEEMLAAFSKDNTGAAIYAEDDLDIKGPGVLLVNGYINNGIRGSESIEIHDGNLTVECGNDALKTTSTKVGKGFIEIDSGKNLLQAGGNGISAQTDVTVLGGETVIESQKTPVKLGGNLSVSGGSLIGNGVAF